MALLGEVGRADLTALGLPGCAAAAGSTCGAVSATSANREEAVSMRRRAVEGGEGCERGDRVVVVRRVRVGEEREGTEDAVPVGEGDRDKRAAPVGEGDRDTRAARVASLRPLSLLCDNDLCRAVPNHSRTRKARTLRRCIVSLCVYPKYQRLDTQHTPNSTSTSTSNVPSCPQ